MTTTSTQPLKICYRAEFQQPRDALNPAGWKVPGPIGVEVRKSGTIWLAFRPGTPNVFNEITVQADAHTLMNQVPRFFQTQLTDWVMYEITEPSGAVKLLNPDEIWSDKKGRVYRK